LALAPQRRKEIRAALTHDGCRRSCVAAQDQFGTFGRDHADSLRERARQQSSDGGGERVEAPLALDPALEGRVGGENLPEGAGRRHDEVGKTPSLPRALAAVGSASSGGAQLNIILVSNATARARTLTLDWRHAVVGGLALVTVFVAFAFAFNYVALRYAAAIQHPWLQAMVLADQRQEAQRTQQRVQGHLNAMALKVGELQAQLLRLDGLGEHLAKAAGLKPQELPSLQSGRVPGRGGAESSVPAQAVSVNELSDLVARLGRQIDERSDQLGVLEALLVQDSANRKFLPTLAPIEDGWFSSNFGFRIDPFTGLKAFHDGIDFPADVGTPIIAAASGKVIEASRHPEYGKILTIDHGNGLVSRYAHASQVYVGEGDLVVRGQRVAAVGSTGRSTGPHLHFEVRMNGVPQNPARFLRSAS
jgi:murein DD-endopeptidase MepM/ murein hydrolase activator NlpD